MNGGECTMIVALSAFPIKNESELPTPTVVNWPVYNHFRDETIRNQLSKVVQFDGSKFQNGDIKDYINITFPWWGGGGMSTGAKAHQKSHKYNSDGIAHPDPKNYYKGGKTRYKIR